MKIIKYQVHDVVEEAMEEETQKQDEQHKKVRDKFILIQKLLEIVYITSKKELGEGPSMSPIGEARNTNPFLSKLAVGCRVLKIKLYVVDFPMLELQEEMKTLSHLNILVSWIPTHIL
jgi:hypothetical protein